MKRTCIIFILLISLGQLHAQDTCRPKYNTAIKVAQLSSVKLAYLEKGKGKTILFIHGLGGNLSHWMKSVESLSSAYRCIAIDLPGYGWSSAQTGDTGKDKLQYYAGIISEFLQKKKIKNVTLAGHSMGAQVATIIALQNKRVKKLVLVAPAGLETFTEKESALLKAATSPASFEKQDEKTVRNNFKVNFFQQPADAEPLIQDRLRLSNCPRIKNYAETVSAGVAGMLAHPVRDSLQYLTIPVLILFGSNDALIPNKFFHPDLTTSSLATSAATAIKNAKVELISDAGHMVIYEKSEATNTIIKSFLQ